MTSSFRSFAVAAFFILAALLVTAEFRVARAVEEVADMALKRQRPRAVPTDAPAVKAKVYDAYQLARTLAPGEVGVAFGLPGSGKTTIVERAADNMVHFSRVFVFDPFAQRDRGNWQRGDRARKPWWPHRPLVPVDTFLRQAATGQTQLLDDPNARVVVCGTGGTFDRVQLARDFSTLVGLLEKTHEVTGRRTLLVAEEFGQYGRDAVDAVNLVATGGAHLGLGFFGITQRWGRIQKDARELVSVVVAGAIGGEEDYVATAQEFGRDFADRVRALTPPENFKPTSAPIATRRGHKEQS